MISESTTDESPLDQPRFSKKNIGRLTALGAVLTAGGIALFAYFIYSVGITDILANIERFGFLGFGVIVALYGLRILLRATAWSLSVYEPYRVPVKSAVPAVIIGEAMSSLIPLGILVSGTAKAIAVRRDVPLVVGLSSVATENLFYSITTSLFLTLGALTFLGTFELDPGWALTIDVLIIGMLCIIAFLVLMIVRQWHFASETCEWIYRKGLLTGILERGRMQVRLFENFIYGFYRRHPKRFLPIILLEASFHILGVLEVFFILGRIGSEGVSLLNAFLLESISRLITIVFKLVPFMIGVDEAGAQYIAETAAIGAGIGVTIAIIRKGRIMFWAIVGVLLIVKRGLSLRKIFVEAKEAQT